MLHHRDRSRIGGLAEIGREHVLLGHDFPVAGLALDCAAYVHSALTSLVKAASITASGNTDSSSSRNSKPYSSEKRIGPSSRSSSARNSGEMRGQSVAATRTRVQSSV